MKCGSLKRRDERKQNLDTGIYPVVRIATKVFQYPRCWSTHEECRFPVIKSLPWTQSRSSWSRFPLRSLPTKERGSPRQPYKVVVTAPHQAGGSMACRRATKCSKEPTHRNACLVHSKTSHKAQHLAFTLSKELILALTLTKRVLSLRIWSICTWVAWRCSWMCMRFLGTPASFKWPGWGIYIALQLDLAI